MKNEAGEDFFELADEIMERGRLKALGGAEGKGMSFVFDFKLKTQQSSF